jgi:hypothetical protein
MLTGYNLCFLMRNQLYPFTSFAFFAAGRILLKYLQATIDRGNLLVESALRAEVDVFIQALHQMGEKLPIGSRQGKMLEKLLGDVVDPTADLGQNIV